jgi:hypothetical protein
MYSSEGKNKQQMNQNKFSPSSLDECYVWPADSLLATRANWDPTKGDLKMSI